MKRLALVFLILLSVVLTACSNKSTLTFNNQTACGTATIILTNIATGNMKNYTVDEGQEIEIELDPEVDYSYEVQYPRQPDYLQCDSKTVIVALDDGQTLNVRLENELDEELIAATATAEAEAAAEAPAE
ncbi:MAG: hypothetical protein K8S97_00570 [Anaerolineae bacterium]|nr:hypothetical protein [Anaerolineae bacterium]